MKYFSPNQHVSEAGFAFLLDQKNAETEPFKALDEHIQQCEQCQFELYELRDLMAELNDTQVEKKPSSVLKYVSYAAAILVIYASSIILLDSSSADFLTHEKYEMMIEDEFRSSIIKEAPKSISHLEDDALFIFDESISESIELIILNHKEEIQLKKRARNGKIKVRKADLPSGIHYWKIETEDELLKVGKFIVD